MELGIYSFGETALDPATGEQHGAGSRLRALVEEVECAERVGLDVFGVGEHHRADYAVSAPAVVLAAAAARTTRIRLTPAVSVLSSDDPVRVFQQYATLDQLSGGRAEIMVGRGSFTESFPLFGQDLADYEELFDEKLALLLRLRERTRVEWRGRHRPDIDDRPVYPRPAQDRLPIWIAVGGTPRSVVRAAGLGLPMALAIIGGTPARFRPLVELYREAAAQAGVVGRLPLSINGHGFIADDATEAREIAWPPYLETMGRIGRERGWPPPTRARFEAECDPDGALFVGDPREVADKILAQQALFGHDRTLLQFSVGPLPHESVLRSIELFGAEVGPLVRQRLESVAGLAASRGLEDGAPR
ncbi:MAG: LLM class flavin-dependent oxidoreductase [Gemmatimonadetes bacterium]|nr:LLM class flavin-dependent oxidoreductase [Gemmatimonadota bacterium]MBT8402389.1 LLM class flavin-dependent oxidoreductase [Gemmatimonadota bacterium]NNF39095.1 LLM class flavin-dependent oxidoreductase [Gemmatimonadota bacterium]